MGDTASLKVPSLPFKSLQDTSRLNGRAYAAASSGRFAAHHGGAPGVPGGSAEDLDDGQGLSPDEVAELRRTTDLASVPPSRLPLLWAGPWQLWW